MLPPIHGALERCHCPIIIANCTSFLIRTVSALPAALPPASQQVRNVSSGEQGLDTADTAALHAFFLRPATSDAGHATFAVAAGL